MHTFGIYVLLMSDPFEFTMVFHAIYSILNSTKETLPKVWALTQRLSDSTAMKVGPENERQENLRTSPLIRKGKINLKETVLSFNCVLG